MKSRKPTEKQLLALIAKKYGQGHGSTYKPWFNVRDVPSEGRSTMGASSITGRVHHYLSDLEEGMHLLAEFEANTVDIREQYALLPRGETQRIAEQLGIRHPRIPGTGVSAVMTTDLVISKKRKHGIELVPISVKASSALEGDGGDRIYQKYLIERAYWLARGYQLLLVTEKTMPRTKIENLRFLRPPVRSRVDETINLQEYCDVLLQIWTADAPLIKLIKTMSARFSVSYELAINALGSAIWAKELEIDHSERVQHDKPLKLILRDSDV